MGTGMLRKYLVSAAQAGSILHDAVLREVKEETGLDVKMLKADICLHTRENPGEGR